MNTDNKTNDMQEDRLAEIKAILARMDEIFEDLNGIGEETQQRINSAMDDFYRKIKKT